MTWLHDLEISELPLLDCHTLQLTCKIAKSHQKPKLCLSPSQRAAVIGSHNFCIQEHSPGLPAIEIKERSVVLQRKSNFFTLSAPKLHLFPPLQQAEV